MLLAIPNVLTPEQVAESRRVLEAADWVDGRVTAGHQGARVKDNMQLPADSVAAQQVGQLILQALGGNPLSLTQQALFFDWIRLGAPLSRLGFEDR